jgi:hypothetical protein
MQVYWPCMLEAQKWCTGCTQQTDCLPWTSCANQDQHPLPRGGQLHVSAILICSSPSNNIVLESQFYVHLEYHRHFSGRELVPSGGVNYSTCPVPSTDRLCNTQLTTYARSMNAWPLQQGDGVPCGEITEQLPFEEMQSNISGSAQPTDIKVPCLNPKATLMLATT